MGDGYALTNLRTPEAEIDIDTALVGKLLAAQHPDLGRLPIEAVDAGWDNALFRLGAEMAVRLPRRSAAAPLVRLEQRWLPELSKQLPIAIPAPLRIGIPGEGFPWSWSVVPWLHGSPADLTAPNDAQGEPLARFLQCLHVAAPADAPTSRVRGVPLSNRAAVVEERLRRLESRTSLVSAAVWHAWHRALEAPRDGDATWIHGDLHARNVLVDDAGALSGVIDWGDMAAGDKATDLAAIWMLLPGEAARRAAMEAYPDRSEALWDRARGWAVALGALLLETGLENHPRHARMGDLTLRRVVAAL